MSYLFENYNIVCVNFGATKTMPYFDEIHWKIVKIGTIWTVLGNSVTIETAILKDNLILQQQKMIMNIIFFSVYLQEIDSF